MEQMDEKEKWAENLFFKVKDLGIKEAESKIVFKKKTKEEKIVFYNIRESMMDDQLIGFQNLSKVLIELIDSGASLEDIKYLCEFNAKWSW